MNAQELKEKVARYEALTKKALETVELKKGLSAKETKTAQDFLEMATNYFLDAQHFKENGDWLTALAAFSYAHAWLDAGVRSRVLDGKNNKKLFVLPKFVA